MKISFSKEKGCPRSQQLRGHFAIEYLRENKIVCETIFEFLSLSNGAQVKSKAIKWSKFS